MDFFAKKRPPFVVHFTGQALGAEIVGEVSGPGVVQAPFVGKPNARRFHWGSGELGTWRIIPVRIRS